MPCLELIQGPVPLPLALIAAVESLLVEFELLDRRRLPGALRCRVARTSGLSVYCNGRVVESVRFVQSARTINDPVRLYVALYSICSAHHTPASKARQSLVPSFFCRRWVLLIKCWTLSNTNNCLLVCFIKSMSR